MRSLSGKQSMLLKAATRRSVDMAGGGESFSHRTRVRATQLSKYGSTSEPETFMPLDVAVEADLEAGVPIILSAMAELLGYKLVPVSAEPAGELGPNDALRIANEMGDVIRTITEAMADGHVDAADRRTICREIDEAKAALRDVLNKVGA